MHLKLMKYQYYFYLTLITLIKILLSLRTGITKSLLFHVLSDTIWSLNFGIDFEKHEYILASIS